MNLENLIMKDSLLVDTQISHLLVIKNTNKCDIL